MVDYARAAGIIVPDNLYDTSDGFRHWSLYCEIQIERPISSKDALLHNAKVVASISNDRFRSSEPFRFEEISSMLK